MKLLLLLTFVACAAYYVYAEDCKAVSTCTHTLCPNSTATAHVHMECTGGKCTCSTDVKPCIVAGDCNTGRCIESHGNRATFHCLDGGCKCLNV